MTCTDLSAVSRPRPDISRRAATFFGIVATTFFAASSAPTPLYRHYQDALGLSPAILTLIFAAYVLRLLVALLIAGSLSDHVGRRPVIFAALLLNTLAMALFDTAGSAGALITARGVQGLATGMATTALGAALLDNHKSRGALLNSLTIFAGLTFGALGSGLLVTFAPAPTRLIYVVLLALSLVEALLVWTMLETAKVRPGLIASLRPRVSVPRQARQSLLRVSPVNIAAWAIGGFYLSLMPSLVSVATGLTSPLVGAGVVAALTSAAALVVVLTRDHAPAQILSTGTPMLALGMIVTLAGVHAQLVSLMLIGTIVAGFGMGSAFAGTARTILPLAAPSERAGLLSAFYVESYLAYSLPTIFAGFLSPVLGLPLVTDIYGAAIVLLTLTTVVALHISASGGTAAEQR